MKNEHHQKLPTTAAVVEACSTITRTLNVFIIYQVRMVLDEIHSQSFAIDAVVCRS